MTDTSQRHYTCSVKEIAEFCWRSGDYSYSDAPSTTAAQGQDIHRFLQAKRKQSITGYQAEVPVSKTETQAHDSGSYLLQIKGRIDSLWQTDRGWVFEEIKSTLQTESELSDSQHQVHLAQAKLYAWLWTNEYFPETGNKTIASDHSDLPITVRVTYWHLLQRTSFIKTYTFSRADLADFYHETLRRFTNWLDRVDQHRLARQQFIHALEFPFSGFREGQKALAGACYHTMKAAGCTFIHAATGIGKSISSLFGSLKSLAETDVESIWYLTAKTSGQQAVIQALEQLLQQGNSLKCLLMTSQEKICFCHKDLQTTAASELCQWQQGFYDRKQAAMDEAYTHSLLTIEVVQTIADRHQVCPHHLMQLMAPWVDVVVADFNYVFSFTVRNQSLLEKPGNKLALLVDESHNLPARCRDLYQAQLSDEQLNLMLNLVNATGSPCYRALQQLKRELGKITTPVHEFPEAFFVAISQAKDHLDQWTQQHELLFSSDEVVNFKACLNQWQRLSKFCEVGLGETQGQAFSLSKHQQQITLECNNPAAVVQQLTAPFASRVYFSGSLLPLEYFQQQLCLPAESNLKQAVFETPFPHHHLKILLANLDTRFAQRESSIPAALSYIKQLYQQHPGFYLVCVSSYSYLQQVMDQLQQTRDQFNPNDRQIPLLFQQANTDLQTQQHFKNQLRQMEQGIAFVIMGGSFAEGVEWPAGRLKGVVVMGSGMPSLSRQQKRLQTYYERTSRQGFEFAYLYPAVNRIVQTVGRIQRGDTDAGVVLLLDQRFRQHRYRRLFPRTWQYQTINSEAELAAACDQFWQQLGIGQQP